jgi:hypothetical protein
VKSIKRVLCAQRLRRVPAQFSWVDQRLVHEGYIERCDVAALALYLFLVTVADAQGLSYYGEATLARRLHLGPEALAAARQRLIDVQLIAYRAPVYQVLALPGVQIAPTAAAMAMTSTTTTTAVERERSTAPVPLAQLFEQLGLRRDRL